MTFRLALILLLGCLGTAQATQIAIDYSYAGDFFSPTTEEGQAARATVESVAAFYSAILDDSLAPLSLPAPVVGEESTWSLSWDVIFSNPSGIGQLEVTDPSFAADELRIYVGSQPLVGTTSALAGSGGYSLADDVTGTALFYPAEINEIRQRGGLFEDAVLHRGQGSGEFATWGGSISFDSDSPWNFDHTVDPSAGQSDLFSVATHEFSHVLGVGGSSEWQSFISGAFFMGAEATAANGGTPVGLDPSRAHWSEGTMSTILGTQTPQEASFDPSQTSGQRKRLTELDAAALRDLGWTVVTVIPEPAACGLALLGLASIAGRRR